MHGAKPNSIKTKIDEMETVPEGYSYNHANTWQRLEKNLQGEKQNNYRWWLYAAVILLLAGGFLIWKLSVNSNDTINDANKIVKSKENPETPKEVLPENSVQVESVTIPVVIQRTKDKAVEDVNQQMTETIQKDTLETQVVASQNIIEVVPALLIDSGNANVVEKTAKPKFRIAHINELNKSRMILSPSEEKNSIVFKKPLLSSINEEPLSKDEKTVTRKKSKSVFSPVSSSQ